VVSSRRVKKGPGRRPQSAKRQQFLKLLAQGWTAAAARREVGVSRATSHNWRRGHKVRLKDGTVRFVPPLDPLTTKEISPRFLSEAERVEIADRRRAGETMQTIADAIGRSISTVSRELGRNSGPDGTYRPFEAHRAAALRRQRPRPTKLATDPELCAVVKDRLAQRWSPAQISRFLRREFPDRPGWHLVAETIYQELYRPTTLLVRRPEPSPLRTGRDHHRAHVRFTRRRRRFGEPMLSVHQRPFRPEDRSQPGHWEGDVIVGPQHRSAIGTLVERHTRLVKLILTYLGRTLSNCVTGCCASWPAFPRRCCGRSPGIRAVKWPDISRSPRPPAPRCISAMPAAYGNADRMRTPMDFCGNTFQKEPTYPCTAAPTSLRSKKS
jgi:IS30 family transposase